jgi:hypothetical protein
VISSLKSLAKQYNRTVIFTIHQPQSNIVALFDRLVLLGKGQLVYSGEMDRAQQHFEKIGHPCPPGYNIADYLIDLTVDASGDSRVVKDPIVTNNLEHDHEGGSLRRADRNTTRTSAPGYDRSSSDEDEEAHNERTSDPIHNYVARQHRRSRSRTANGIVGGIKAKASKLLGAFSSTSGSNNTESNDGSDPTQIPEKLASLVLACRASDDAKIVEAEIMRIQHGQTPGGALDVNGERGKVLKGYKKAGVWDQFRLLSGRAFKNLYR